jgi:hypothetical protein
VLINTTSVTVTTEYAVSVNPSSLIRKRHFAYERYLLLGPDKFGRHVSSCTVFPNFGITFESSRTSMALF